MELNESEGNGRAKELHAVADLAGTPVADVAGEFFGEVYGALSEADTGLLRYLDLALHGAPRHVLVPVGHTRIVRKHRGAEVRLRAATREELALIPLYDPETSCVDERLAEGLEEAIVHAHCRLFAGARYYAHPAFDHRRLYGGIEQPIVQAAEPRGTRSGLAPLSELEEFAVADPALDVRGWPVRAAGGEEAGTVRELIADPAARAVRYLRIAPEHAAPYLLPAGYLRRDPDAHVLRTPELSRADLGALPRHGSGAPTRAEEDELRAALDRRLAGERLYHRPDYRAG